MSEFPQATTNQYAGPPKVERNALGLAGFITSLVGLLGGCVSPISFLLSLFALGKRPRGFAIAGLVLSLVGLLQLTFFVVLASWGWNVISRYPVETWGARFQLLATGTVIEEQVQAGAALPTAETWPEFARQRGLPPEGPAGHPIEFKRVDDGYQLRAAGLDGKHNTADDIVFRNGRFVDGAAAEGAAPNPPAEETPERATDEPAGDRPEPTAY